MILRTQVNVTVELLEILKIGELDSMFSCKIILLLTWLDQVIISVITITNIIFQRLEFTNLKNDSDYNTMSAVERDRVTWQLVV